jgi:hypothetical protein
MAGRVAATEVEEWRQQKQSVQRGMHTNRSSITRGSVQRDFGDLMMSKQWKTPQVKPKGKPKAGEDVDPRVIDRMIAESQRRHDRSANNGFGYRYSPETLAYAAAMESEGEFLIASATKTLERSSDLRPHAKLLADLKDMDDGKDVSSSDSSVATTLTQDPPDDHDPDEEEEEEDEDASSVASVELLVLGTLTPNASGKAQSLCESLYLMSERSVPQLIAMSQGILIRQTDIMFDGRDGFMFDLDGDDLLKTFPQ